MRRDYVGKTVLIIIIVVNGNKANNSKNNISNDNNKASQSYIITATTAKAITTTITSITTAIETLGLAQFKNLDMRGLNRFCYYCYRATATLTPTMLPLLQCCYCDCHSATPYSATDNPAVGITHTHTQIATGTPPPLPLLYCCLCGCCCF